MVYDLGFVVLDFEFRVSSSGFWFLGFGGLGFGVWVWI